MVSDAQVLLLRKKMMTMTQEAAAAAAGMSVRTARKWQRGGLPSVRAVRSWRTRPDPFAEVWAKEVVPILEQDKDGAVQATTLIELLVDKHPGEFQPGQVRTLQRRVQEWRAKHGPGKEVFFEQEHQPGKQASLDFTHADELKVTIGGQPFPHLLFELVLCFSGWLWACIAHGETFEALVAGLQGALWALGGVPDEARSDNLSAATHQLREGGRSLTRKFRAVLDHYGLDSSRIQPGKANENGVVEQRHHRSKKALAEALVLRGSRDFDTVEEYAAFIRAIVGKHNGRIPEEVLAAERAALAPLPSSPVPNYTRYECKVRRWSTIRVGSRTYSVPATLINRVVEARMYPDTVEVLFRGQLIETMPRLRGNDEARIDYRHIIWSLVRKPGAFAGYRYREELFPTLTFRRAYDALRASGTDRADVEYVRVLHLAASTSQDEVERTLQAALEAGETPRFDLVHARTTPPRPAVPQVAIPAPDLSVYDGLLRGGAL
ncbi:MAG: IS21 family transposase [Myxococcota bacterium]|jgi:hypothetical protein|nr:IS21 family transposase [Myxococcota bacterium]